MLPFFLGFAFLGISVFQYAWRFKDPYMAFLTLFCVTLGDEISNVFNEIMQLNMLFGALFLFSYLIFSMSFGMYLFLVIIQKSLQVA